MAFSFGWWLAAVKLVLKTEFLNMPLTTGFSTEVYFSVPQNLDLLTVMSHYVHELTTKETVIHTQNSNMYGAWGY